MSLSDIDECEKETHNCDMNAFCVNIEGSYTCMCNDGYSGDGHNGTCEGTSTLT